MNKKAFTLIELLIVVAIIAILAAIAVPNFLEAQTRAKVSRAKSDMRTTATALESYYVDNNDYPLCHPFGTATAPDGWDPTNLNPNADSYGILERISTPIAYVSSAIVRDSFDVNLRVSDATALGMSTSEPIPVPDTDNAGRDNSLIYQSWNSQNRATSDGNGGKAYAWLLHSVGPDSTYHNLGGVLANDFEPDGPINLIYDPTNGTISFGSIYRTGGSASASDNYAAGQGLVQAIQTQD